jgi:hypothetical protein
MKNTIMAMLMYYLFYMQYVFTHVYNLPFLYTICVHIFYLCIICY